MERFGMLLLRSFLMKGSKPGCAIVLGEECGISLCNAGSAGWPSRGVQEAGVVAGGSSPTSRMRSGRAECGGDCWWWDTEWQSFWGREIAPPWGQDWRNGSEIESRQARGWSNSSETGPQQASSWSGSSETGPWRAPGGSGILEKCSRRGRLLNCFMFQLRGCLWGGDGWGSLHDAGGEGLILGGGGEVVAGDASACSRIFYR